MSLELPMNVPLVRLTPKQRRQVGKIAGMTFPAFVKTVQSKPDIDWAGRRFEASPNRLLLEWTSSLRAARMLKMPVPAGVLRYARRTSVSEALNTAWTIQVRASRRAKAHVRKLR